MINVYYAFLSAVRKELDLKSLPPEWESYVSSITDDKRRTQSYYVRKLLLRAFDISGIISERFVCDKGRWRAEENTSVDFSLAHSYNVVAAAVSTDGRVGVDVEKITDGILKIEKKFVAADVSSEDDKKRRLTEKWTEKESAFKCDEKKSDGEIYFNKTALNADGEDYILCVASHSEKNVREARFVEIKDL